jgi:hypothetical protein
MKMVYTSKWFYLLEKMIVVRWIWGTQHFQTNPAMADEWFEWPVGHMNLWWFSSGRTSNNLPGNLSQASLPD